MPPSGSHTPIKKYNYERSLFRWIMSRNPEEFDAQEINTKTLERVPKAREAFYRSNWPGAKELVHSSDDSKFERTTFFDAIIERGLHNGTTFSIDHVTADERSKLGIAENHASGEYYLLVFGSTKGKGRNFARRGSITSSDGGSLDQHAVMRELGDLIHSEIEAAGVGEDAEIRVEESRVKDGPTPRSRVLSFSVSIQPRGGDSAGAAGAAGGEGRFNSGVRALPAPERAGGAAAAAAAADAGGGNPTGAGMHQQRHARPAGCVLPLSEARQRQLQELQQQQQRQRWQQQQYYQQQERHQQGRPGHNPKKKKQQQQQQHRGDGPEEAEVAAHALIRVGGKKSKPTASNGVLRLHINSGRPVGAGGSGAARESAASDTEQPAKRYKSTAQTAASASNHNAFDTLHPPFAAKPEPMPSGGAGAGHRGRPHGTVPVYPGSDVPGTRSFLTGNIGMPPRLLPNHLQSPAPHISSSCSPSLSSTSSSSSSSASSSSPSQYGGACAGTSAGEAAQRAPPPGYNMVIGASGNNSALRAGSGGSAGGSVAGGGSSWDGDFHPSLDIEGSGNTGGRVGEGAGPDPGNGSDIAAGGARPSNGSLLHAPRFSGGASQTSLDHYPQASQGHTQTLSHLTASGGGGSEGSQYRALAGSGSVSAPFGCHDDVDLSFLLNFP